MSVKVDELTIWTDGACHPNPGRGGWAWVTKDGRKGSGAAHPTTNQRMELTAVIEAIRANEGRPLRIISDSMYAVKGASAWINNWVRRDWRNSEGKPVANVELWKELLALKRRTPVTFEWVKGHAGNAMNERADQLACEAAGVVNDHWHKTKFEGLSGSATYR